MLASPECRREPAHDQGIQLIPEERAVTLSLWPLWIRKINEIILPAIRRVNEEQPVTEYVLAAYDFLYAGLKAWRSQAETR